MREGDPDPKTGEYALLGGPPRDGDLVRLCARVYNFALNDPTGEFDVLFEIVPIDKIGQETGPRETVGTAPTELDPILPVIDQVPMAEACVPWDTTGFFSPDHTYRFYVTLDPGDEEWKDAKGEKLASGNNEGFWPWGSAGYPVLKPDEGAGRSETVSADIITHADSLAVDAGGEFLSGDGLAAVEVGGSYRLRANLQADGDLSHFCYVAFSEGPPGEGRVIAIRKAGIMAGDNYCWARWTPREPGEIELYVYVLEDVDSPTAGDAVDSLLVTVLPQPTSPQSWRDELIELLK
ncbi:MAG: hypothetical protein JRF65_08200 [Deltaproteobacteria bacterium]|nr:hypothetical protein [Deltaproteobacteria bacterium]